MIPALDYEWKCIRCSERLMTSHKEAFLTVFLKCPKCGAKMIGSSTICRGPAPENPFKKY